MKFFLWVSLLIVSMLAGCSNNKRESKGFQVYPSSDTTNGQPQRGFDADSLGFNVQPGNTLQTGMSHVLLTPVYKVNIDTYDSSLFVGSNTFHYRYDEPASNEGNNWSDNVMPGWEAVYGFNMVNVSHYDVKANKQTYFFEKPVLIRNLYYPSLSRDTLNGLPVSRDYFLVSVYPDDTNKDGFVNLKDLRRIYLFSINGENQKLLIPENYSVMRSEYDFGNDRMLVYARLDSSKNGEVEDNEPIHIFWIDLKSPINTGRMY